MKKITVLLLALAICILPVLLASCDQESVDNTMDGIMSGATDALGPFFKKGTPSDSSTSAPDTSTDDSKPTTPQPGALGGACPDYELKKYDSNGYTEKTVNPADSASKVTILYFWSFGCLTCQSSVSALDQIAKEYSDVSVITVHSYTGHEFLYQAIGEKYNDCDITFTVDGEKDELATMVGSQGEHPYTVIIDENGIIVDKYIGASTYETLKETVDKLLEQKK